nr:hypothetical protein [Tanacetum cinerariifolium]
MNEKSKDTVKARQDLQTLGIRSGLWLDQTKNGKCLKPQAASSFTPENQKKFYPEVSTTSELFALACGPTWTLILINSCVVGGVRYVVHNRDERRITQNNGICSLGPVEEMYYGQLQEILEFKYLLFKVVLFRVKWFNTRNQGRKVKRLVLRNSMTQIDTRAESFKDDQYILVTQVKQVLYLEDKAKPYWRVVEHVNHKKFFDGGRRTTDIIDVVDEDDDITDDEDALLHDLANSNNEDLINVDDDDVTRSYGDDDGGEDCPPPHHVPAVAWVALLTEVRISGLLGKQNPNLGGRAAGRLNTRDKTQNLSLKDITDTRGPVPIQFELRDKQTVMPLSDHAAHWSSYIGRPHMESPDWTEINAGIQQHLQKAYNTNKAAFKAQHWVIDPTTGTYNVEKIRRERPENFTASEWDKYIEFWNDPRNIARAAQNRQNWMQTSSTQEYLSLIDTFFVAHTVNGEFLRDEDRRIYEEMRMLEAMGTYTDDEINRLARG